MLNKNIFLSVFLLVIVSVFSYVSSAYGLIITEPKSGSVFHPGDKVIVKAVAAPEENPVSYLLFTSKMPFSTLGVFPPYVLTFTIPLDFTGSDKIIASAKYSDGNIVETEIEIKVVLPSDVKLEGIKIDPSDFILLKKLPPNSDPNHVRIAETETISVGGIYSDGVERWIASSADGTTYKSSNEKVAVVDKEGVVSAQGIGKAIVTVSNGNFSVAVEVIVKPYK